MRDAGHGGVIGKDGLTGVLLDPLPSRPSPDDIVRVQLATGETIEVPADAFVVGSNNTYLLPIGPEDIRPPDRPLQPRDSTQERVVPVLAEELSVDTKRVPTGGVRVNRRVFEHDETIEVPLLKEHLDVRRVVIDREVDGPLPVRRDGDTTIIPIVEEVLVVSKRYRLKEEIYVSKSVREELHTEQVTVRRQEAEIDAFDADGRPRPVPTSPEQPPRPERRPPPRRRSILEDR